MYEKGGKVLRAEIDGTVAQKEKWRGKVTHENERNQEKEKYILWNEDDYFSLPALSFFHVPFPFLLTSLTCTLYIYRMDNSKGM